MGKSDKPYKEPPEFYWFRSTIIGSWPIRREGWLTLLIGFGGFLFCTVATVLASFIGLGFMAYPLLILAAIFIFGMIIVSAVRTDRQW